MRFGSAGALAHAPLFGGVPNGPPLLQISRPVSARPTTPAPAPRRAGPQAMVIVGMNDQRGDAPRDIEWTGALPVGQLGIPGGWRAPSPEVFQFAGVGLVKRLAGALREPRAVALGCGEFVLHHFTPLRGIRLRLVHPSEARTNFPSAFSVPSARHPGQGIKPAPSVELVFGSLCAYLRVLCISALKGRPPSPFHAEPFEVPVVAAHPARQHFAAAERYI